MTRRRGAYGRIRKQLSRQQTRPEPEPMPEPMNLTASATMTLHSAYIDALARQTPDNLVAMLQLGGGISFGAFLDNLARGWIRLRPSIDDEGEPALAVEVLAEDGYLLLCLVRASLLHLDSEELGAMWSTRLDDELRGMTEA